MVSPSSAKKKIFIFFYFNYLSREPDHPQAGAPQGAAVLEATV